MLIVLTQSPSVTLCIYYHHCDSYIGCCIAASVFHKSRHEAASGTDCGHKTLQVPIIICTIPSRPHTLPFYMPTYDVMLSLCRHHRKGLVVSLQCRVGHWATLPYIPLHCVSLLSKGPPAAISQSKPFPVPLTKR
jgi:hypothetical protein